MERRHWLGVLAAASVLAGVLSGCNIFAGLFPRTPARVRVQVGLPAGSTLDPASLQLDTAMGLVGGGGTLTGQTPNGTLALVIVRNAAGKAILLGFVPGGSSPNSSEINAKTTANALLFMAIGGFGLPFELRDEVLAAIDASAAAGQLASVIAARVLANPTALADGDSTLFEALGTAVTQLVSELSGSQGSAAATARAQASQSPPTLLTISPQGGTQQSGVEVLQNPDGSGMISINHFRRRCKLFAYETGHEDDGGTRTHLDHPRRIGAYDIGTTQGLSDVGLSYTGIPRLIYDVATGDAPWAPKQNGPLDLPADTEFAKTFFDVIVIGPSQLATARNGPFNLSKYSFDHAEWQRTQDLLALQTCIQDVLIPILGIVWDVRQLGLSQAQARAATEQVEAFLTTSVPQFLELTREVKYAEAVQLLFSRVVEDPNIALNLLLASAAFVTESELLLANQQAMAQQMAHRLQDTWILFVVNSALAGGDLAAVLLDHENSVGAETWEAVGIVPKARIEPPTANVRNDRTQTFMARMNATEGLTLRYEWKVSSSFGRIGDGGEHTNQREFLTDRANVVYRISGTPSNGSHDTLSVKVYQQLPNDQRRLLGSTTAEITTQTPPDCDELDTAPYTSGCGGITIGNSEVTAGQVLTVSVFAGCGGARLACDYADPSDVYVDGVLTPGNAGYPNLYSYDPPRPVPRGNGASVQLSNGAHTVQFRIRLTAPNDCLKINGTSAVGPWVTMGSGSPNTWSSVAHFRVRQGGL